MSRWMIAAAIALPLVPAAQVRAGTEVTTCNQAYRGTVYLSGDVDCTNTSLGQLVFNGRGRLLLRGFTLTGGVACTTCTVVGPGTITGSSTAGVRANVKAVITNATITGNAGDGVEAHRAIPPDAKVVVRGSTITANGLHGVDADLGAKVVGSEISGNGMDGVFVPCNGSNRVVIRDSTLADNGGDPVCGDAVTCADIATCNNPPRLIGDVQCETSYVIGSGVPGTNFGICSLD